MSEPLPSRTKNFQAMSRPVLKVTVGLLKGYTTLRDHIFKAQLTQQQVCRLCSDEKEDSVYIVCHCLVLACK
jgi:hypothetical protein